MEVNFQNGKQDGLETWWWSNGQKEIERKFKDGKLVEGSESGGTAKANLLFAASVNPNLKYEIKGDTVTITGCNRKPSGEFTIPDGVTSIQDAAFNFCLELTSITIPNGVTSIGRTPSLSAIN